MFILLRAGQGSQVASGVMADKIEWCGGMYHVADLKAALAMVLPSDTPQDQLLAGEYSDPWAPDTWQLLGDPAQSFLRDLAKAQAQAAFNAHVSLNICSSLVTMHHYAPLCSCILLLRRFVVWQATVEAVDLIACAKLPLAAAARAWQKGLWLGGCRMSGSCQELFC